MSKSEPFANPHAQGNILHGKQAFQKGIRKPEDVLRWHLTWNRGAAAEYHFSNGFKRAAEAAKESIGDALRLVDPIWPPLTEAEKHIRLRIWQEVRANTLVPTRGSKEFDEDKWRPSREND